MLTRPAALIQGDWHISTHVSRRDSEVNVNGSIWLEPGGTLELINATLQLMCSFDRQFNVTWRGGRLVSSGSTVGGKLAAGLCMHTNLFVYDGVWDSTDDVVRCSYGILFSPVNVGWLRATGLRAGVSADSVIMGGRGNVSLTDSRFSLNLGLTVAPGVHHPAFLLLQEPTPAPLCSGTAVLLDLPANRPLTEVLQPAGSRWTLALRNTSSTHWFVELDPIQRSSDAPAVVGPAAFAFSARTSPFNLHLHTSSLTGSYALSHQLVRPVAIGNVVLRSAEPASPVRVAAFEVYAHTTQTEQVQRIGTRAYMSFTC